MHVGNLGYCRNCKYSNPFLLLALDLALKCTILNSRAEYFFFYIYKLYGKNPWFWRGKSLGPLWQVWHSLHTHSNIHFICTHIHYTLIRILTLYAQTTLAQSFRTLTTHSHTHVLTQSLTLSEMNLDESHASNVNLWYIDCHLGFHLYEFLKLLYQF